MVLNHLKDRYCVRQFSDKEIPDEVISDITEAGRLAPSWVNVQPWHFIVIKDKTKKELLAKLAHGQPHVAQAPVVIACCGDFSSWEYDKYRENLISRPGITEEKVNRILSLSALNPDLLGRDAVYQRTLEQVTYATAYMSIEAQNKRLGCCIIGGIGNEYTKSMPDVYAVVKAELNLPDHMTITSLLLLGYEDESYQTFEKSRKPADKTVSFEEYQGS